MAQATPRARAPLPSKKRSNDKEEDHNHYSSHVPAIKGLLGRGDRVAEIATHLHIDPAFIAAIADGTIRVRHTDALDMSRYRALPCCRSANVNAAIDSIDAAFSALQADDKAEATEHLVALRRLLQSFQTYWNL